MSERDLPTIKQICQKAAMVGDVPLDEEESRHWFESTVQENREHRIRAAKESAQ